jgi:DNA mismatch endonuclease (patch repair protein)
LDNLNKTVRSKIMRAIRSLNTRPELCVRHAVYSLGYRYRVKGSKLPGKPDLVFRSRRRVIFVHGCFWHVHKGCSLSHIPAYEYWRNKLARNVARDRATLRALKRSGWKTLVLWECELSKTERISRKLVAFLGPLML